MCPCVPAANSLNVSLSFLCAKMLSAESHFSLSLIGFISSLSCLSEIFSHMMQQKSQPIWRADWLLTRKTQWKSPALGVRCSKVLAQYNLAFVQKAILCCIPAAAALPLSIDSGEVAVYAGERKKSCCCCCLCFKTLEGDCFSFSLLYKCQNCGRHQLLLLAIHSLLSLFSLAIIWLIGFPLLPLSPKCRF